MKWIIGIDEVGRGPLAGPVYVCAAAMPVSLYKKTAWRKNLPLLTDSKRMNAHNRMLWYQHAAKLKKEGCVRYALASKSAHDIDMHGITTCISLCITKVLRDLKLDPEDCTVLLDGGLKAPFMYTQQTVIKGDLLHPIISLASVIAKVSRDTVLARLHLKHPEYSWNTNKGYGTKAHTDALRTQGITTLHRKTYLRKYLTK